MNSTIYSEVRIHHYDDIEQYWCVDAWKTDDPNEEGRVVATIDDDFNVTWLDDKAKDDVLVNEEIRAFIEGYEE